MESFRELLIHIFSNYAHPIGLLLIAVFVYLDFSTKKRDGGTYGYRQRLKPVEKEVTKEEYERLKAEQQAEKQAANKKVKRFKLAIFIVMVATLLAGITLTITLYLGLTTRESGWGNPINYTFLFGISMALFIGFKKPNKYLKYFLALMLAGLIVTIYTFYCYGTPYFYDLIILIATIVIYIFSEKYKVQNTVVLLLLGINILIASERHLTTYELATFGNIVFAVGTSIVASGIVHGFIEYEKHKRLKEEKEKQRSRELEMILMTLEEIVCGMHNDYYALKKQKVNFRYVDYVKFEKEIVEYIDSKNARIRKIVDKNLCSEFKFLAEELKKICDNERQFLKEEIFAEIELIEMGELYFIADNIVKIYDKKDLKSFKLYLKRFFNILRSLEKVTHEFEELINTFGKDKLVMHYKIGGGVCWSDGSKFRVNETYQYQKEMEKIKDNTKK